MVEAMTTIDQHAPLYTAPTTTPTRQSTKPARLLDGPAIALAAGAAGSAIVAVISAISLSFML